ncbi:uncharacterized protein RB166_015777 isoform 1-T2 [Leptodactylus fuscus]
MRRKKKFTFSGKHFHMAICSRDDEVNFQWLKDLMEKRFSKKVTSVDTVYVTNNSSRFYQEMSQYTFAVLYHTKKRGRLNVTNITDSLYDEELKYLYDELGKDNVIVVIDDLEDIDDYDMIKNRILRDQQDIGKYSSQLLLFGGNNKEALSDGKSTCPQLDMLKAVFRKAKYLERKKKRKSASETKQSHKNKSRR